MKDIRISSILVYMFSCLNGFELHENVFIKNGRPSFNNIT